MALRFDRMAVENVALYDIMGVEDDINSVQMLGQIAVLLPKGQGELEIDRNWIERQLGPLQGSNFVGAQIQVPAVRFWRYVAEDDKASGNTNEGQNDAPAEQTDMKANLCRQQFNILVPRYEHDVQRTFDSPVELHIVPEDTDMHLPDFYCDAKYVFSLNGQNHTAAWRLYPNRPTDNIVALTDDACHVNEADVRLGDKAVQPDCAAK